MRSLVLHETAEKKVSVMEIRMKLLAAYGHFLLADSALEEVRLQFYRGYDASQSLSILTYVARIFDKSKGTLDEIVLSWPVFEEIMRQMYGDELREMRKLVFEAQDGIVKVVNAFSFMGRYGEADIASEELIEEMSEGKGAGKKLFSDIERIHALFAQLSAVSIGRCSIATQNSP
jgi:hypothetical protein